MHLSSLSQLCILLVTLPLSVTFTYANRHHIPSGHDAHEMDIEFSDSRSTSTNEISLGDVCDSSISDGVSWGEKGHTIVGVIAESFLSSNTLSAVKSLLASGQTISREADWADCARERIPKYRWTAPLHYINTPDWECQGYKVTRDCQCIGQGDVCQYGGCVDGAIQNFTGQLKQYNRLHQSGYYDPAGAGYHESKEDYTDALKFILHFMGDIHQPLRKYMTHLSTDLLCTALHCILSPIRSAAKACCSSASSINYSSMYLHV
jgi:hypothetical protein